MNETCENFPIHLKQWWKTAEDKQLQPTVVRLKVNARTFDVSIKATAQKASNAATLDNEDAWKSGDLLEVFVQDPSADFYTEWHITPEGRRWRKRFDLQSPDSEKPFHSDWITEKDIPACKNELKKGLWIADFSIPWTFLTKTGKKPDSLRWTVCRYDYNGNLDSPILSSTAPLTQPNFHRRMEWNFIVLTKEQKIGMTQGPE